MKQMTLYLDKTQQRPVVNIGNGLTALLDTGAYVPVWTGDEKILTDGLGATLVKKQIRFFGFGGYTLGNLYTVTLQIGDIIYPNMNIIANNTFETSFYMIMSATMLNHLIYEIDDYNHRLNITIPDGESTVRNLRIIDTNGKLHVLCNSASNE